MADQPKAKSTPEPAPEPVDFDEEEMGYDSPPPAPPVAKVETPPAKPPEPPLEKPAAPARDPATGQFVGKPKHPAHLIRAAEAVGLGEGDITALSTQDLRETIRDLREEQAFERRERGPRVEDAPDLSGGVQPEAIEAPVAKPGGKPVKPASEDFSLTLTREEEEDINPAILKALRVLASGMTEVRKLGGVVGQLKQRELFREHGARTSLLDTAFASLPKEQQAYFGEGSWDELPKDGTARQRRMAAVNFKAIDHRKGQAHVTKMVKEAAGVFHTPAAEPYTEVPEEVPTTEVPTNGNQLTPDQKRWNDSQLARPTAREGPPAPKGKKAAMQAVKEWKNKHRAALGGDEENDLPD